MRDLTLDEKISIKGVISKKHPSLLDPKIVMRHLLTGFYYSFGKPLAFWYLPAGSNWQRRVNPIAARMDRRWKRS